MLPPDSIFVGNDTVTHRHEQSRTVSSKENVVDTKEEQSADDMIQIPNPNNDHVHDASSDNDKESASSPDQEWNALDEQRLAELDFEDDSDDDDRNDDDEDEDVATPANEQASAGAAEDEDYDGVGSDAESESEENDKILRQVAAQDLREEYESLEQELIKQDVAEMAFSGNDAPLGSLNDIGLSQTQVKSLYSPYFGPQRGSILDLNEDPFAGLPSSNSLYQEMWEVAESAMWRKSDVPGLREGSVESGSNKKRVRFEETKADEMQSPPSSVGSDEDEDPNEAFPDLFTALEEEVGARNSMVGLNSFGIDFGDSGSYYDYDEDDERHGLLDDDDDSEYSDDSSTYENDDGDTTDEETEEEHLARLQVMRVAAAKAKSDEADSLSPIEKPVTPCVSARARRPVTPKAGKGLRLGTFALDPERAAMSVDASNRKIVVQPPTRPAAKDKAFWVRAKKANNASRPTSPNSSPGGWELQTPGGSRPPLTPASTLGTMFGGNLDLLRASDPPALQPSFTPSFVPALRASHHSSFSFHEDSDDDEDIDMEDFIDMDDYASESDEAEPSDIMSATDEPADSMTPTRHNSGMLNHLEHQPSLVGSFRLNQNLARHVSSLASHPEQRASTLESNALQKGRRNAANTPMTPARKNRGTQDLLMTSAGIKKQIGSPHNARRARSRGTSLSGPGMQETLSRALMQ